MNKRGQFYLIAAIVIIGIIAGLAAVYNQATTTSGFSKEENLAKEMQYELNQIIDNGLRYGLVDTDINSNIKVLTDHYAESNKNTYFLFIFKDENNVNVLSYNNDKTSQINISYASSSILTNQVSPIDKTWPITSGDITITLSNGKSYSRQLNSREILIFMKKEIGGETFVKISQ